MPRLVCSECGRTLWATAPVAQLFAEERLCSRCGASLADDRRLNERRVYFRRQAADGESPTGDERRAAERREAQRRKTV